MTRHLPAGALGLALTLGTAGLAACSGGSSGTTATSATASAPGTASASATLSASGTSPAGNRGIFGSTQVRACLKAAGITVPSGGRGGFPSGSRTRPSGTFPSGSRPSFSRPSGAGGGFGGDSAEGQKIQAALKACGITLPTGGNRPRGTAATPTASPTS